MYSSRSRIGIILLHFKIYLDFSMKIMGRSEFNDDFIKSNVSTGLIIAKTNNSRYAVNIGWQIIPYIQEIE